MEYITFLFFLGLTCAQYLLGVSVLGFLSKYVSPLFSGVFDEQKAILVPYFWVLGLLLHLSAVFLLKTVGAQWWLALFLPFIFIVLGHSQWGTALDLCVRARSQLKGGAFIVWMVVIGALGWTLFSLDRGISTPWVNNYGDLTFHLGMIHHFAFQGDFPAQYHVFAGETLSYPFYINLWTVVAWWPFEGLASLRIVFVLQWMILWACIYAVLSNGAAKFLPWLLLFGGGSVWAVVSQPDTFSWGLINDGFPWTTWLSTIWVTQRSALLGATVCLVVCCLALNVARFTERRLWPFSLSGLMLGLAPLVHTHYFLVTALFLGFYLLAQAVREGVALWDGGLFATLRQSPSVQRLIALVLSSLLALLFLPTLMGKTGMVGLMLGWTVPIGGLDFATLGTSVVMWISNVWPWFLVWIGLWCCTKEHAYFGPLLLLFLLGNIIKLAVWEWDQLKVFLAIFTIFLVLWRLCWEKALARRAKIVFWSCAILLVAPGMVELGRVIYAWRMYQVYSPEKIKLSQEIRRLTPVNAVIASADEHNSAATLSGRSIYFGYPGTLYSHRLPYQARERMQKKLAQMLRCDDYDFTRLCPQYLVWDAAAKKYWQVSEPGAGFTRLQTKFPRFGAIYVIGDGD